MALLVGCEQPNSKMELGMLFDVLPCFLVFFSAAHDCFYSWVRHVAECVVRAAGTCHEFVRFFNDKRFSAFLFVMRKFFVS